jgi:itaconate CoA-transferase
VLAALYERQQTGQGRVVGSSLFDALSEWMGYPAYYTKYGGAPPARAGVRHATVVPYGSYRCGDGNSVLFAVQTEAQWRGFCEIVCERPEWLTDPRYVNSPARLTHRAELEAAVEDALSALTRDQTTARLEAADIPYGDLNTIPQFLEHPQLAARDRWRTVQTPGGAMEALLPPITMEGFEGRMEPVPAAGEHTNEILAEIGFSPLEIQELRASHAV